MTILTRNVTGPDILAIQEFVTENEPVEDDPILGAFYPGNEMDPYVSDQLKPLKDTIAFLEETDQIVSTSDGYRVHEEVDVFPNARLSLLNGIRTEVGEDSSYNEVLEHLAEQDGPLFNRGDSLAGELNSKNPRRNWNEEKLRYWARVLEWIGVIRQVNHRRGGNANTILSPRRDLMIQILSDVCSPGENQLATVLGRISDRYLPTQTNSASIAPYLERSFLALGNHGYIQLSSLSDMGQSIPVGDRQLNAIRLREEDTE